jgi:hypothetical protein
MVIGSWTTGGTPTLTEKFAGIGSREINKAGEQAIRDVYENTFKATTQPSISVESNKKEPVVGDVVDIEFYFDFVSSTIQIT